LTVGVVAAYTIVHVIAFTLAGIAFVAIAEQLERTPSLILLAALGTILLDAVVVTTIALEAYWVLGAVGMWSMLVSNVLALAAMGAYVWWTHPVLRHRLRDEVVSVRV
jgi:hypothetical protein